MEDFKNAIYRGALIRGDLNGAIQYVAQFPEKRDLYERYQALFAHEEYITYDISAQLNQILLAYQKYIRDVLYCKKPIPDAEGTLLKNLKALIPAPDDVTLAQMDEEFVPKAFTQEGFFCIGGQTGSYYGPYIWREMELRTFSVELPGGVQDYSVRFMDGFIFRSWLAYISFDEVGTGGWSAEDGIIGCVKSAYEIDSEGFKVSLLKHEAQHEMDKAQYEGLTSQELEYRAKLVELIYSEKRNLLEAFLLEADTSHIDNGHALASNRIAEGFTEIAGCDREHLKNLQISQVQSIARELFDKDTRSLQKKLRSGNK